MKRRNLDCKTNYQSKDLQKMNEQHFFKSIMSNYDNKRVGLKKYLYSLEEHIQQKEFLLIHKKC